MRIFIFQYLQMWMLEIMRTSTDANVDIWSTSIRDGLGADFLIFTDVDTYADIYFQYLQTWILKIRISYPPLF